MLLIKKKSAQPDIGKLILNHLILNNCTELRNRLLDSYFLKLTLGSDCLEHCFWIENLKNYPDSAILQKCQLLSIPGFKHNSTHMSSLDLTQNLFLNVYYTKKLTLAVLRLRVIFKNKETTL